MTQAAAAKTAKPVKKQGFLAETVEIVKTVIYALLIALVLRVVLFQPYTIPSASEEPNLYRGDYIIVSKWSYGWSQKSVPFLDLLPPIVHGRLFFQAPNRGDIIVFALPHDGHTNFIKRLVGLPGDRIQMKAGRLYINDQPVAVRSAPIPTPPAGVSDPEGVKGQLETNPEGKTYLTQVYPGANQPADAVPNANNTSVYVIPPHCYFMMGDNRDDSLDSRFDPQLTDGDPKLGGCGLNNGLTSIEAGVGFVPEENLIGKAQLVLVSWDTGIDDTDTSKATLFKPWTWITDLRFDRFFRFLH